MTILGDFLPEALDFRSSIAKAKMEKFDALGLYLLPSQVRAFLAQARALELRIPYFGMDVFQSKQTIEQAQGTLDGAVFPTNLVDSKFEKRYVAAFNDDSHMIYAANGYEFAKTVAQIKGALSERNSELTLKALLELPAREGAMGQYVFRKTKRDGQHFQFPVVLKRITGSAVQVVP